MTGEPVYLDYQAKTPVDPSVSWYSSTSRS